LRSSLRHIEPRLLGGVPPFFPAPPSRFSHRSMMEVGPSNGAPSSPSVASGRRSSIRSRQLCAGFGQEGLAAAAGGCGSRVPRALKCWRTRRAAATPSPKLAAISAVPLPANSSRLSGRND
jgi:hypothetical protein